MKVRERAYKALLELESGGYSGEVLRRYASSPTELSKNDRKLLWELVLGVIKWKSKIDSELSKVVKRYRKLDERVKNLLRLGYYQIHFLDKIPFYSVVDESVKIAKTNLMPKYVKFVNAVLRRVTNLSYPVLREEENLVRTIATNFSYPDFMIKRWLAWFGIKDLVKMLRVMNSTPPFTLWVNVAFTSVNEVRKILREMGIEVRPYEILPDEFIQLFSPVDVSTIDLFKEGLITPQDPASRIVTKVVEVKKGETVLDACAAPGIKTAQVALDMKNEGRIVAFEIDPDRYSNLLYNVRRLGAVIVDARRGNVVEEVSKLDEKFDRVIVDAPCSDLGTVRRRPEIRYRRTYEDILRFSGKQKEILKAVSRKLKKGGVLVYSVCSFEREETIDVFEFVVKECGLVPYPFDYILENIEGLSDLVRGEGYVYLLPHITGSDGFFIARFRRI